MSRGKVAKTYDGRDTHSTKRRKTCARNDTRSKRSENDDNRDKSKKTETRKRQKTAWTHVSRPQDRRRRHYLLDKNWLSGVSISNIEDVSSLKLLRLSNWLGLNQSHLVEKISPLTQQVNRIGDLSNREAHKFRSQRDNPFSRVALIR